MVFKTMLALATAGVVCAGDVPSLRGVLEKLQADPVTELNATSYVGRWYQMYSDAVVMDTFEKNSDCDTADYTLLPNGTISLRNGEFDLATGKLSYIDGFATIPNASEPGKLEVQFTDGGPHIQGGAPYWVMALGPLEANSKGVEQYAYSIVADSLVPLGTLFVLARDVDEFNTKYDSEVRDKLSDLGFKYIFNKPLPTRQTNCTYLPLPGAQH